MSDLDEFFKLQEDGARRIAWVAGSASASQAAIDELEARRAAGEDAVIWRIGLRWMVGPRMTEADLPQ